MSTKAQVKTRVKAPAAPAAARIIQPPLAVPERGADRPDIATQLEGADRLGHSLGAIGVRSAAPSQTPAKPLIQRQELPEEDKEELQMKREPAAVQRQELPEEEEEEELQMKLETAILQRQELPDEEEELQTKPANGVQRQAQGGGFQLDDQTAGRINRARGGGQSLEGALSEEMSASLGHDFSGVRVHTGAAADALNRQLSAKAFTTGPDIFFRQGEYNPNSSSGRELIGHELIHVIQQASGRMTRAGSRMRVRPPGDVYEEEADRVAKRVGQNPLQRQAGARQVGGEQTAGGGIGATQDVQRFDEKQMEPAELKKRQPVVTQTVDDEKRLQVNYTAGTDKPAFWNDANCNDALALWEAPEGDIKTADDLLRWQNPGARGEELPRAATSERVFDPYRPPGHVAIFGSQQEHVGVFNDKGNVAGYNQSTYTSSSSVWGEYDPDAVPDWSKVTMEQPAAGGEKVQLRHRSSRRE